MSQPCPLIHVAPAEQPTSVPEIAEILFPAYTVNDGRVSLAGCALEDRLILQLVYECGGQRLEIYLNSEGKEVDGQPFIQQRKMKLAALANPPDGLEADLERLLAAGSRLAGDRLPAGSSADLTGCQAIWCKYVEGKLRFTIGGASIDLPFSGWTRTLAPAAVRLPTHGGGNLPPGRHRRRADRCGRADRGLRRDGPPSAEYGVGPLRGDRSPRESGTGRDLSDQRSAAVADRDGPVWLLSPAGQSPGRGAEASARHAGG